MPLNSRRRNISAKASLARELRRLVVIGACFCSTSCADRAETISGVSGVDEDLTVRQDIPAYASLMPNVTVQSNTRPEVSATVSGASELVFRPSGEINRSVPTIIEGSSSVFRDLFPVPDDEPFGQRKATYTAKYNMSFFATNYSIRKLPLIGHSQS
jgi:hypothetical protein